MILKEYKTLIMTFVTWIVLGLLGHWAISKFVSFKYKPPIDVKQYPSETIKEVVILDPKKPSTKLASYLASDTQKVSSPQEVLKVSPERKEPLDVSGFSVKMIIVSEAGNFAVVNDLLLKEGDMIEDFKIEKIRQEGVLLSRKGEQVWIK